jgi:hypothetical protein
MPEGGEMNLSTLIDPKHPDSPQLLTVAIAAVSLPISQVAVVAACVRTIWKTGDLGSGACWALGLSSFVLAAACGIALKWMPGQASGGSQ